LTALAIASEWELVTTYAPIIGLACLSFNLISLASGYLGARAVQLGRPQATAIAFEIGVHNATIAIYIALNVVKMPGTAIAPAIYSLIMYLTAAAFAYWLIRQQKT
jgi:BASS family bile acid:Na+ symporter